MRFSTAGILYTVRCASARIGCTSGMRSAPSASTRFGVGEVAQLRAQIIANPNLGEKYINNILAVLSKALRYAADCEVIAKAPKIGLFKVERPEIVAWDFAQYTRLLASAKAESPEWYAAG